MFQWVIKKFIGTKHERQVKRMQPRVEAINALEPGVKKLSDEALRRKTVEFKEKIERGAKLDDLLIEAFAVVREAGVRTLGQRHYDVQLIGGMTLHEGRISEMKTGEGKTLVSTLPAYLNALLGRGVHIVTVNDYLAGRDAEWMGKIHKFLGLTVGCIHPRQSNAEKKRAYLCDITYGQNNEYGFDYLRDNMKFSIHDYVQRDLYYAIVDEVDSILVDEARTPLIISGPGETASDKYARVNEIIPRLRKDEHYTVDEKARSVTLTEEGIELAQKLLRDRGIIEVENLYEPVNLETVQILQNLLRAHTLYKRDQNYMVSDDGKVLIIDEFTGRVLPGRRWSDGLHQAVEAKERVPIQDENITLATISFQNLFRLYEKLAGMTGTADTEATEFHKTYKLDVLVIPTHRPVVRADHEDLVYKTEREKFRAVVKEIEECNERGQPVLVGTTSVEKSDALHRMLEKKGIAHNVLNAKQHEREAYVVAQAGRLKAVTVATNMAGRGTDIVLGGNPEMLAKLEVLATASEELKADEAALEAAINEAEVRYVDDCKRQNKEVKEQGGLHILGTERHESRRIDNQLRGRGGRQGDPGSSRFYLSLEDDLMRIFAGERITVMMDRLGMEEDVPIEHKWVTRAVENAQKKVEERNFDIRKNLLEYDDVMNQQRKSVYTLRRQILTGQYRTVPTDEEKKKGIVSEAVVKEVDDALVERAAPILEQMIKIHSAELPPKESTDEEIAAARERALAAKIGDLKTLRWMPLERDVYMYFGCVCEMKPYKDDPKKALEVLRRVVGMSLTEQRERLLDLVDELVSGMVEHACPAAKQPEDWDFDGLARAFREQFGVEATGVKTLNSQEDLAEKLYKDGEAILRKKEKDFGAENFLRLFRNFYLQEIDRQWILHLQSMDHLRDGIGLRGYGQRDPKKEYKREGFDMFLGMMQSIRSQVAQSMFRVERVREEDIQRLEEQRRKQAEARQRQMQGRHASATGAGPAAEEAEAPAAPARGRPGRRQRPAAAAAAGAGGAPADAAAAPGPVETVRRERPKVGRNDPCWCGSGKKYKKCHYAEDQRTAATT
jgi:preprotein translocase subunit SecA